MRQIDVETTLVQGADTGSHVGVRLSPHALAVVPPPPAEGEVRVEPLAQVDHEAGERERVSGR